MAAFVLGVFLGHTKYEKPPFFTVGMFIIYLEF